jgi:hypothetical protein
VTVESAHAGERIVGDQQVAVARVHQAVDPVL